MEFRILGSLEVYRDGAAINIPGPRTQIILALLLLEANHAITIDRMIEAVWDDEPPTTARSQVYICISALRKLIATPKRSRIELSHPGYALKLDDARFDSHEFDSQIAAARRAMTANDLISARADFRGALSLWRGEALAGIGSRIVQQSITRLNERRLAVLEECLDCELRLGVNSDLVSELVGLVEEHPLRERLRAMLMAALYRVGRQAEALEVYRRTRDMFVEQIGIEPGKELQDLQRAILNGKPVPGLPENKPVTMNPAPASATPASFFVPRLLPAAIPDFTGRDDIVNHISDDLTTNVPENDNTQGVPVTIITGQGGAGKTALAIYTAHKIASDFPDGQLYARMLIDDNPANPADVLERFLRALGINSSASPDLLEERAEMYRDALADRKVLILLDDVDSEQQVANLIPGASGCSVIITSRSRLPGLPVADRVEVGAMSHQNAIELLSRIVGSSRIQADPKSADALCRLCDYLPLALRIVAARLIARPHWSTTDLLEELADESRRLDGLSHGELGVRTSLSLSYSRLSSRAQRLFRRLALLDTPDLPGWIGAPLLDTEMHVARDLLEELAEAHLVEAGPSHDAPSRYRVHDITRLFAGERLAEEESPQEQEMALQRWAGALLYLASEAHNRIHSGYFTLPSSSATRWVLPRAVADRLLKDPLDWLEHECESIVAAIRATARSGLAAYSWDLALNMTVLFHLNSNFGDWKETHEAALKAACRAGDIRGEAAMRYSLGSLYICRQQNEQAGRQCMYAYNIYGQLDDRQGMALALRNLAFIDMMNGNLEMALSRSEEALDTFQLMGDRIAEAFVIEDLSLFHLFYGDTEAAGTLLDRAQRIGAELGNRWVQTRILQRIGDLNLSCGRIDAAYDAYQGALAAFAESNDRINECYAMLGLSIVSMRRGDLEAARGICELAEEKATASFDRLVMSRIRLVRSSIELKLGCLEEAARYADDASRAFEDMRIPEGHARALLLRGKVHAASGNHQKARVTWQAGCAVVAKLNLSRLPRVWHDLNRMISAPGCVALSSGPA